MNYLYSCPLTKPDIAAVVSTDHRVELALSAYHICQAICIKGEGVS